MRVHVHVPRDLGIRTISRFLHNLRIPKMHSKLIARLCGTYVCYILVFVKEIVLIVENGSPKLYLQQAAQLTQELYEVT